MAKRTVTEISETKSDSWSKAPNGSAVSHDYYTTVTSMEDWHDVPENGIYAGRTYVLTDVWISHSPDYRGQIISSSSRPE